MSSVVPGPVLASFPGSLEREINMCGEPGIFSHVIKIGPEFLEQRGKIPGSLRLHNFNVCVPERRSLGMRLRLTGQLINGHIPRPGYRLHEKAQHLLTGPCCMHIELPVSFVPRP